MVWIKKRYYPLAKDVKKMSDKEIIENAKKYLKVAAGFNGFTEAKQYGVFIRALKKEIVNRKLEKFISIILALRPFLVVDIKIPQIDPSDLKGIPTFEGNKIKEWWPKESPESGEDK